jgi:vacuolar iron transporter family protein
MIRQRHHLEQHRLENLGWLRAAVLGANDGVVSTASLILGVAGASASPTAIVVAGVAGLVAGAMSMATGEYVSVSSQADTEAAALEKERGELAEDYSAEERELMAIYVRRGLDAPTAKSVAHQLMQHDALGAHARDELGLSDVVTARPLQAALASALSFAIGAAVPLVVVFVVPSNALPLTVAAVALVALSVLGGLAAWAGGANVARGLVRVTFWSAIAMAVTFGVGRVFGASG